jgi:hypothetical protein
LPRLTPKTFNKDRMNSKTPTITTGVSRSIPKNLSSRRKKLAAEVIVPPHADIPRISHIGERFQNRKKDTMLLLMIIR